MKQLKVLFIASELTPLAKVGGLADVIGALPIALEKLGVDVRIAIPRYGTIDSTKYPLTKVADNVPVPFNGATARMGIWRTPLPGSNVPVYLLENQDYLSQGGIYFSDDASSQGSVSEAHRFLFLSRACLELFGPAGWYPDIIHCHDWHVGMVPVLLKVLAAKDRRLAAMKSMLTIHNLEYQGWYPADLVYRSLNLNQQSYPTLTHQSGDSLSTLQQAILSSDLLTTVSPSYAQEILTPEYGAKLEPLLQRRRDQLFGILNGIDTSRFNPETDKATAAQFSTTALDGKRQCKAALQKLCGLPEKSGSPLIGLVSRLATQKGLDLVTAAAGHLAQSGAQLILLGTGEPAIEQEVRVMLAKYPQAVYGKIAFDARFAQAIYAGADMFLMPSRFEPCGLGQMIAMRYGTVPIVRATGGLRDTVHDYTADPATGDGFSFTEYRRAALTDAVKRAVALYAQPELWYTVVKRIMQKDFSWSVSAQQYRALYTSLTRT
ncbi:MAG: glycogen/starch synthase [Patescibacteria group bacterium]